MKTVHRIESSCAMTGAYQYTEVARSPQEAHEYCVEPWRSRSVHVVYALLPGVTANVVAVYAAGRRVSPLFPWSGEVKRV